MTDRAETCGNCRYYDRLGSETGWCKAKAPLPSKRARPDLYWPTVRGETDWCGEWRATKEAEEAALRKVEKQLYNAIYHGYPKIPGEN